MEKARITYTYSNGQFSHFTFRKVDGDCNFDKSRTVSVGVFCKTCPFYYGIEYYEGKHYVICTNDFYKKDDEGTSDIRHIFIKKFKNEALCAFYE